MRIYSYADSNCVDFLFSNAFMNYNQIADIQHVYVLRRAGQGM